MTRIKLERAGFEALLTGGEVRAFLRPIAEDVAARARAAAPVETGSYRDSIRVEEDTSPGGGGALPRARFRVVADIRYAQAVESAAQVLNGALP